RTEREALGTLEGYTDARMDPRLRVLYLAAVAVGAFVIRDARIAAGLAAAHAIAWLALGLGARKLARQLAKLAAFAGFIIVSYALTSEDETVDRWIDVSVGQATVALNVGGAAMGGLMVLRVVLVVLASRVARAGDPTAIAL